MLMSVLFFLSGVVGAHLGWWKWGVDPQSDPIGKVALTAFAGGMVFGFLPLTIVQLVIGMLV